MFKKLALVSLLSFISYSSLANPKISPTPGLSVKSPTHAFSINGLFQLDTARFWGDNNNLPSGSNIKNANLEFNGTFERYFSYAMELVFANGSASVTTANISFNQYAPLIAFTIGQVSAYYSLENTNSGKWIPFLERSLPTVAFAPSMGLGFQAKMHFYDQFALMLSAVQPFNDTKNDVNKYGSDRWKGSFRLVYSPVHTKTRVYDFGITGIFQDVQSKTPSSAPLADVQFKTRPEARGRKTPFVLDTGLMQATSYTTNSIEAAGLWGPFVLESEYFYTHVNRTGGISNLAFHGWYLQSSYVLTGESREYKFSNGSFGKVTPTGPCGAWEVGARYSYLNLNDEDILGGSEHNLDLSLSWYVNKHIRLLANWIHASIHPNNHAVNKDVDTLAGRVQIVW